MLTLAACIALLEGAEPINEQLSKACTPIVERELARLVMASVPELQQCLFETLHGNLQFSETVNLNKCRPSRRKRS